MSKHSIYSPRKSSSQFGLSETIAFKTKRKWNTLNASYQWDSWIVSETTHTHIYIYIYIYIEREREKKR